MTDIKQETEQYAQSAVKAAQRLADTIETGQVSAEVAEHYGLDEDADWMELLDTMALEIYGTKEVGPYRDSVTSITVITGTGGPDVEFSVDVNDRITGAAYWSSDSAKAYDNVPGLFDALLPLIGEEA